MPITRSPSSPRPPIADVVVWAVSRVALLILTLGWFNGDTETYFDQGHRWLLGQRPYADYPVEYPPGAALLFRALVTIAQAAAPGYPTFRVVFVLACLACDAAMLRVLLRRPRSPGLGAPMVHALVGLLLYPIWLVRFDLFPSLAVLLAAAAIGNRDHTGPANQTTLALWLGIGLGTGIALKLYPALLFLPWAVALAAHAGQQVLGRKPLSYTTTSSEGAKPILGLSLFGGVVATAVVALSFAPALLAGAGAAVFSFLDYHRGRGLQIETSYAAVVALVNLVRPHTAWHVPSHHAHDLGGPLAEGMLALSRILHPAALLATAGVAWRRRLPLVQTWAALLAVALFTASVFSPQFLIWLLPLALLANAHTWRPGDATMPLVVAALTTLVFPLCYDALIAGRWFAVLALLLRNGSLLVLALDLLRPRAAQQNPNS